MRVLGIIPARGGSKGIPRKNLKKINNKTLIEITYVCAKNSKLLTKIAVSSDCNEILDHCKEIGLASTECIKRPDELASDTASSASVVRHALEHYEQEGDIFDAVVLLQPTNPMRKPEWIDKSIAKLREHGKAISSVVTVVNVGGNHPQRMYRIKKNVLHPIQKNTNPQLARQKLEPIYIRSGDVYCCWASQPKESNNLIGEVSIAIEVGEDETINIDKPLDLEIARYILKQ